MDSFLTNGHSFYIIPYETCSKADTVANNLIVVYVTNERIVPTWNDIHKTRVFDMRTSMIQITLQCIVLI